MRILHIGQHHELVGGAEVHREQVMAALAARGHQNAFFGTSLRVSLRERTRRVVRRPAYDPERLASDWRLQRELGRLIADFEPELVHLHQVPGLPLELYSDLAASGLPIVETIYDYGLLCPNSWAVHGDGRPCQSGPGAECFRHGCTKNYPFNPGSVLAASARLKLVRGAVDVLIAPTEHLRSRLLAAGMCEVVSLPYYPVAKARRGEPPAAQEREPLVLVVARLEREKGVHTLVEAFARLAALEPSARLEVIGDGPERTGLEQRLARLGLEARVLFRGATDIETVRERMAHARLLAIPSIWMEALPLVTFDANAAGLPIVAHSIGGLPEAVADGDSGLLVPVGDAEAFAAAMRRLLTDEVTWTRFSRAGAQRGARFTEQMHLDGIERCYRRALDLAAARLGQRPAPMEEDERVLLDAVLRHCGSLEKELNSLQQGWSGKLIQWQRRGRRMARKLAERIERLVAGRPAARGEPARPAAPLLVSMRPGPSAQSAAAGEGQSASPAGQTAWNSDRTGLAGGLPADDPQRPNGGSRAIG
jgi:glycosyltransferase involved in cell wall biosynthesis